jgi:hypothetical protein
MQRAYIIAPKEGRAPEDWPEQLRRIPGVQVRGGTTDQATIVADDQGIARVREQFGGDFLIEEEVTRTPGA